MKRIVSVILILSLVLAFAACGQKEEKPTSQVNDAIGITKKYNEQKSAKQTEKEETKTTEPAIDDKDSKTTEAAVEKKDDNKDSSKVYDGTKSEQTQKQQEKTQTEKTTEKTEIKEDTTAKNSVTTFAELKKAVAAGLAEIHITESFEITDATYIISNAKKVVVDKGVILTANTLVISGETKAVTFVNNGTLKASAIRISDGFFIKNVNDEPQVENKGHDTVFENNGSIKLDDTTVESFYMAGPKASFVQGYDAYFRNYSAFDMRNGATLTMNGVVIDSPSIPTGFYTEGGVTFINVRFDEAAIADQICHITGTYIDMVKITSTRQYYWPVEY